MFSHSNQEHLKKLLDQEKDLSNQMAALILKSEAECSVDTHKILALLKFSDPVGATTYLHENPEIKFTADEQNTITEALTLKSQLRSVASRILSIEFGAVGGSSSIIDKEWADFNKSYQDHLLRQEPDNQASGKISHR